MPFRLSNSLQQQRTSSHPQNPAKSSQESVLFTARETDSQDYMIGIQTSTVVESLPPANELCAYFSRDGSTNREFGQRVTGISTYKENKDDISFPKPALFQPVADIVLASGGDRTMQLDRRTGTNFNRRTDSLYSSSSLHYSHSLCDAFHAEDDEARRSQKISPHQRQESKSPITQDLARWNEIGSTSKTQENKHQTTPTENSTTKGTPSNPTGEFPPLAHTNTKYSYKEANASAATTDSKTKRLVTSKKQKNFKRAVASLTSSQRQIFEEYAPKFRGFQEKKWCERYEELVKFFSKNGHSQVSNTGEKANRAFARWVKRQRYQYRLFLEGKPSFMTQERIDALERVNFVWDSHEAAFEDRMKELEAFKAKHKHCNVPAGYLENPSLASWVKYQRRQYRLLQEGEPTTMTMERIVELEGLGFQWGSSIVVRTSDNIL